MRKLFLLLLAAGCCALLRAQSPDVLTVKELTLRNGLKVWINEDHSQPKVYGMMVVKAGAIDCPNTGIAHYFEHILFKGTDSIGTVDYAAEKPWLDSIQTRYDQLAATTGSDRRMEIQRDINRLSREAARYAIPNEFSSLTARYGGSGLNATTDYETTCYYNTFAPQYLRQWAELNSARLISPVFRLFQGELETVYEEKNMGADSPVRPALEHVLATLYEGTPYAYPVIGSTENLKNPRLSEMKRFYDRYYVAGNMTLILSGDLRADSIAGLLEQTFGRIRSGEAPQRPPMHFKNFAEGATMKVKLPIPLVKASAFIFRTPGEQDAGNQALDLAVALLSNDNKTGLLDSLQSAHKVLAAMAIRTAMRGTGGVIIGAVPRLPFGSKRKAERLLREQIARIIRGDFSDEALETAKAEALRKLDTDLEDISNRAGLMAEAASATNMSWDAYIRQRRSVARLTKADVMAAAARYLGGNCLRVVKTFGTYPKDRVTQPGYKPVTPGNINAESAFARKLEALPADSMAPRFVDFDTAAVMTTLAPMARLYTVKNDVNDIFNLDIIWHKGTAACPLLEAVAEYLPELGTASLTQQQLGKALSRLGASISFTAGKDRFTVSMKGPDRHFAQATALLGNVLDSLKADKKHTAELLFSYRVQNRSTARDARSMAQSALQRVAYGDNSPMLRRPTPGELAAAGGDSLVNLFRELRRTECSVVYSGSLPTDSVAATAGRCLHPQLSTEARKDRYDEPLPVERPVVYVYRMPSTRQNIVTAWIPQPAAPDYGRRAAEHWWTRYFGGDMSSVMFQQLREMRSLAYYAYATDTYPDILSHPQAATGITATMGTQADKTIYALATLDSLLGHMPVETKNIELARRGIYNSLNNSYPSFRAIGSYIAGRRASGFATDPNRLLYDSLCHMTAAGVEKYYTANIRTARRAYIITGNVSREQLRQLARFGEVILLKKKDVLRH